MIDPIALFGTDQPPAPVDQIRQGEVTLELQAGALRDIRVGDTEIIRSIAFLVRDRDWGTVIPELGPVQRTGDRIELPMTFRNGAGRLDVALSIQIRAQGMRVGAKGRVTGDLETNRAGFTCCTPSRAWRAAPPPSPTATAVWKTAALRC